MIRPWTFLTVKHNAWASTWILKWPVENAWSDTALPMDRRGWMYSSVGNKPTLFMTEFHIVSSVWWKERKKKRVELIDARPFLYTLFRWVSMGLMPESRVLATGEDDVHVEQLSFVPILELLCKKTGCYPVQIVSVLNVLIVYQCVSLVVYWSIRSSRSLIGSLNVA